MSVSSANARRIVRVLAALALSATAAAGASASALAAGEPVASSPPSISGEPVLGQPLQATHAVWRGNPTSYEDFWIRCDAQGERCPTIISGASGLSYTPTSADLGHTIDFGEIAYNSAGQSMASYSPDTQPVMAHPPRHFKLVGPTGIRQFAYYIVEKGKRRPTARDWQRASHHSVVPGEADADVQPGQTIYFNPTTMVGTPFGSVKHTLTPEGVAGKAVHVTASTPAHVRVVLPWQAPAYHPGLSRGELFVLGQLNRKRRRLHLPALRVSTILDAAASVAAHDEAVHGRFPDPYFFSLAPSFGWPGELNGLANIDAPLSQPKQVLAHWDGAYSGESTGLWDEIRSPFWSYVGIADGGGAWNLILVGGCPIETGAVRACGLTKITGM